jgi:hypothetical protein
MSKKCIRRRPPVSCDKINIARTRLDAVEYELALHHADCWKRVLINHFDARHTSIVIHAYTWILPQVHFGYFLK